MSKELNLKEELASLMHDSAKCYLMIDISESQENNYRLADKAIALFESYVKACKPEKRELDGVTYTETVEVGVYNKAADEYEERLLKELRG